MAATDNSESISQAVAAHLPKQWLASTLFAALNCARPLNASQLQRRQQAMQRADFAVELGARIVNPEKPTEICVDASAPAGLA